MQYTPLSKMLLITGAAGFIGSSFLRLALSRGHKCVVLDSLTYAGNYGNIESLIDNTWATFIKGDICDSALTSDLFEKYQFSALLNFAAETHVDNSISGPQTFAQTNVMGTLNLLEASRKAWSSYEPQKKKDFRFVHVSTDEVFGDLAEDDPMFTEQTPYAPSSPYSASKAASDHFVRAWHRTYGLPTLITNCSNNYGPRQYSEKLIPLMIRNCLENKPLPIYGNGSNIRDWIHVEDHCSGVLLALEKGQPGSSYCFGGNSERRNLDVVTQICQIMDELKPRPDRSSYKSLMNFVTDRPGHDHRYAIDDSFAQQSLGFKRKYASFEVGLKNTIQWYLDNQGWTNK